jgi:hypothetical protein
MSEAFIPTLHTGLKTTLTSNTDIAMYVVRQVIKSPGGESALNEEERVSFRKLNSMYGTNKEKLANALEDGLQRIFSRYRPTGGIKTQVTVNDIDTVNYSLHINITDNAGQLLIPVGKLKVSSNGQINLSFE